MHTPIGYPPLRLLLIPAAAALAPASTAAAERLAPPSPFADAVAVWSFDGPAAAPRSPRLEPRGGGRLGVALEGAEREDSIRSGGDGLVADFSDGGWLDAGQGAAGELNLRSRSFTIAVRLQDPGGRWNAPLVSKHGGHDRLVYNLFSADLGEGMAIGFELGTEGTKGMTQVSVPIAAIGPTRWHDVVCRYDGAKLQMFVGGVWMDEGFPVGPLRGGNAEPCLIAAESQGGAIKSGFRGRLDHVALWDRALADEEIEILAGGRTAARERARDLIGDPPLQYFKPHNHFNVGDTLPFFHDGVFHFYYLLDRGHHTAKGGRGAHQWAHAGSRDLVHWVHHPLAVPITAEREGSICTGSVYRHDGTWYAFYATRMVDGGEHLSLAKGSDGIHFTKVEPNPFLSPGPRYVNGFRDPHVLRDPRTGLFHLIVSTMLRDGNGCLAHYTSADPGDLASWREAEPFLVEGREVLECPDHFEWNGRWYLVFSMGGVARYRMSRDALGPWERPPVEVLDGPAARVAKTAAFTGSRRLATAFVTSAGYAGRAVFRELLQGEDGTLGARFPPEMTPRGGDPVPLTLEAGGQGEGDGRRVTVRSGGDTGFAALTALPLDVRLTLRVRPEAGTASLGLLLRSSHGSSGHQVRILPAARRIEVAGRGGIDGVDGLDRPFSLEVIALDGILDICVDGRRTLVNTVPVLDGRRLLLFAERGSATFEEIEARPLESVVRRRERTGR
jgi:hypothetical protein